MLKENLTFNDLPEMVGKLCERIESLENALKDNLAKQAPAKENLHVPMTVEEVCSYLGISKSSFYYKAKHGGIPVIKQGKHLFVYRRDTCHQAGEASVRISRRTGQMAGERKKKPGASELRGGTRADACCDKT